MTKTQILRRIKAAERWLDSHPDATCVSEELMELRAELRYLEK